MFDENEGNYTLSYPNIVLSWLNDGHTINRVEAMRKWGITELNTVICCLRKRGHIIDGKRIRGTNRFGRPCNLMEYRLSDKEIEL